MIKAQIFCDFSIFLNTMLTPECKIYALQQLLTCLRTDVSEFVQRLVVVMIN